MGRGVERIIETCKEGSYPAPKWQLEPGGLWVIFAFPEEHVRQRVDETGQATPPVATLLKLLADKGELGNAEIRELMQLKDRTHLRGYYIEPAMAQGLIEYTLPDKPTSSKQKYKITDAGISFLNQ